MLYDKKCTIHSVSIVKVWNSEEKQSTLLYDNIDCDFYPASDRNKYISATGWREIIKADYEVVIPWIYQNVERWMIIYLGNLWKFTINEAYPYNGLDGNIDNITLQVTRLSWSILE